MGGRHRFGVQAAGGAFHREAARVKSQTPTVTRGPTVALRFESTPPALADSFRPMETLDPTLAGCLAPQGSPGKTQHIALAAGAISGMGEWMVAERPETIDLLICDPNTQPIAARVNQALGAVGRITRLLTLAPQPGEDHLVCDDEAIINVTAILRASPYLNPIAVGSGTLNDITKMASFAL